MHNKKSRKVSPMNNQHNPYAELYEHIKAFEQRVAPVSDEGWEEPLASIKKQILQKQIAYARGN